MLRKSDNSIKESVEKVEQLQNYAKSMVRERSRFEPDLEHAANMCKNSEANYIARKS
jgi:hypothetical protein